MAWSFPEGGLGQIYSMQGLSDNHMLYMRSHIGVKSTNDLDLIPAWCP